MKWIRWGIIAAGALLAGGALTFAVLGFGGAAQAEDADDSNLQRYQELLAQELGISVEELRTAETDARNQLIDELLAAGNIAAEQAERLKNAPLGRVLGGLIDRAHDRGMRAFRIAVNVAEITADVSNISLETVREELQQGKSFAQIASEHGVSRDALKAAITNAQQTALQQAVASGEITQEMADNRAQALANNIDNLIDHTGGLKHRMP